MNINLGNYLENKIKSSKYTKKELCNKLNELFTFGDKPISYSSFSNNIKNGEVTLNEVIAIATLIEDINLNKIVLIYKNKLNNNKGEVEDMKSIVVEMLKDHSIVGNVEYKEENVYEISPDTFEALYVSDDFKIASLERILIEEDNAYLQEVANFTNFDELLGECGLSNNEFDKLPLNEKIDFVAQEGQSALDILGEDMKECAFLVKQYFND